MYRYFYTSFYISCILIGYKITYKESLYSVVPAVAIESDQLQTQTMPFEIHVSMVAGPNALLQDMFREFHY